jgi:DNA-binding HxlR family transcriptional regulator
VSGTIGGVKTPSSPGIAEPAESAVLEQDHANCNEALVRAFEFLGKRWSGVILGTLVGGPLGFAELGRRVEGISDSVLSERLSELQETGLILRSVQPGPPVSVTYVLSPAGEALLPAMGELTLWAQTNLPCVSATDRVRTPKHT